MPHLKILVAMDKHQNGSMCKFVAMYLLYFVSNGRNNEYNTKDII